MSGDGSMHQKELEALAEDGLLVTWDKDHKFSFSQVCRLMAEFVIESGKHIPSVRNQWTGSDYELAGQIENAAEAITRRLTENAVRLSITRHDLKDDDGDIDDQTEQDIVNDTISVALGEDTGCLDPDALSSENCEVLFVKDQLLKLVPLPIPYGGPLIAAFNIQKVNANCFKLYFFGSLIGAHHSEKQAITRAELLSRHMRKWAATTAEPKDQRPPDGFAYKYPDNAIRLNHGETINGCDPVKQMPYWFEPITKVAKQ
ncbi:MAG: hypothetical protein ACJ71W_22215 [Terriglobales bacterium]